MPEMFTFPHPANTTERDNVLLEMTQQAVYLYYRPEIDRLGRAVETARSKANHGDRTEDPEMTALRAKIDPIRAIRHDREAFEKALSEAGMTGEEYRQAVIRIGKYVPPEQVYAQQLTIAEAALSDFYSDMGYEKERACYEVGKREGFRVGLGLASRVLSKLVDLETAARMMAAFHDDETADALLLEFSPAHPEPPAGNDRSYRAGKEAEEA